MVKKKTTEQRFKGIQYDISPRHSYSYRISEIQWEILWYNVVGPRYSYSHRISKIQGDTA